MGIVPRLKSFCCGCRLRDGTLIVLSLPLITIILAPFVDTVKIQHTSFMFKILVCLIIIAVCAAGLYGVFKQKRAFLIPFLVFDCLMVIGGVLAFVQNLIPNIGLSLLCLLNIPIYGYAFLVVLSYFHELGVVKTTTSTTAA